MLHIISGKDSGGAKNHLLNLCSKNDLFQNIIGCINEGVLYEDAKASGIDTVLFRQSSRFDLHILNRIKEIIDENKIDIINFHGARANFLYVFLKKNISIPAVTTIHSDFRYDFNNNKLKYLFFTPLNSLALKKFDNYICVSMRIADLLDEKGYKGRKYVVNNGIDKNLIPIKNRDEIRKMYGISDSFFVYTMVARLHPVKNHIGFLRAAKMLTDEYKDVRFMLVGSGDMENKLKYMVKKLKIEDYVIFAGAKDNALDYINAGDINVLTSFNETFPLVILEGAIVNKAAICSDVGDIRNILDENCGFVIDPYSVEDIYLKMKQSYLKRDIIKDMGKRLHDKVAENYTLEKFRERYFFSYNKILSGGKDG